MSRVSRQGKLLNRALDLLEAEGIEFEFVEPLPQTLPFSSSSSRAGCCHSYPFGWV